MKKKKTMLIKFKVWSVPKENYGKTKGNLQSVALDILE